MPFYIEAWLLRRQHRVHGSAHKYHDANISDFLPDLLTELYINMKEEFNNIMRRHSFNHVMRISHAVTCIVMETMYWTHHINLLVT